MSDESDESDDTLVADVAPVTPVRTYLKPEYPKRPRIIFLGGCPKHEWEKVVKGSDKLFNVVIHNPLEFLLFLAEYPSQDLLERMGRVTFWIQRISGHQHTPARQNSDSVKRIPYWPGDFQLLTNIYASPVPRLADLTKEWSGVKQRPGELFHRPSALEREGRDFRVDLLARQWSMVIDEFLDNDTVPKGDLEVYFDLGNDEEAGNHPLSRHKPFLEKLERMNVAVKIPLRISCDCSEDCLGFLVLRRLESEARTPNKSV
ncbi:hypothetical protein Vi05172_g11548 [Venturia inaequalis]|uniref:Uncharacterized protein n=1 Tax=Venturia inaequalis TaxID=5025 RepID=A0A8H3Z8U3_VENIN|nr:hypothetical protein EG327_002144 [Venturia inaequalis]RDI78483.1 hypothetical protein Vi05172_g11548 [Venturia inaequalis]